MIKILKAVVSNFGVFPYCIKVKKTGSRKEDAKSANKGEADFLFMKLCEN